LPITEELWTACAVGKGGSSKNLRLDSIWAFFGPRAASMAERAEDLPHCMTGSYERLVTSVGLRMYVLRVSGAHGLLLC